MDVNLLFLSKSNWDCNCSYVKTIICYLPKGKIGGSGPIGHDQLGHNYTAMIVYRFNDSHSNTNQPTFEIYQKLPLSGQHLNFTLLWENLDVNSARHDSR